MDHIEECLQLNPAFDAAMMRCIGFGSGYHGNPLQWCDGLHELYCNGWEL